ncbi:MAG: glycosyltransferase family protein [Candidatus Nitrospinota bacterium M3_3B_026]
MSFLDKNIAALRARDENTARWMESAQEPPDLEIVTSKSGAPVPRLGKVLLHSSYYPEKEAEKLAASAGSVEERSLVVFGFGFGYHLEKIAREAGSVTVIEPSPGVLRAAFEARDLAWLIEKINIVPPDEFARPASSFDPLRSDWIDHEPAARIFRKKRDLLAEPFIVRTWAAKKKYRVMVIGPALGGSVPTAASTARALSELGFEVDFVDNTPYKDEAARINETTPAPRNRNALKTIFNNYLGERIAARADYMKPDMILALAQAPLGPELIRRLKSLDVPIIFWFVENHRAIPYWRAVAPHYDYFFGIQKGRFPDMLAEAGAPFAGYLPQAADPAVHHPLALSEEEREKYGSPVSFMGAGYPNRHAVFSRLLDLPFRIWGTEWDLQSPVGRLVANANRRLDPAEYVKIFNASDINLNLSSSATSRGIDPMNDFVNPRTFEIAACGAFQLADENGELAGMFEPGREIATFRDAHELREKIDYYLERPAEREAIARAGMKKVLAEHTFVHRMARMMSVVIPREEDRIERARRKNRGINDVDAILERTEDPELAAFLARFKGQGALSMKKVMKAIEEGEGDLSRQEALFVMIDQILTQGP